MRTDNAEIVDIVGTIRAKLRSYGHEGWDKLMTGGEVGSHLVSLKTAAAKIKGLKFSKLCEEEFRNADGRPYGSNWRPDHMALARGWTVIESAYKDGSLPHTAIMAGYKGVLAWLRAESLTDEQKTERAAKKAQRKADKEAAEAAENSSSGGKTEDEKDRIISGLRAEISQLRAELAEKSGSAYLKAA